MDLWFGPESYDTAAKKWLGDSGHYLENPPPSCLFMVAVRERAAGLGVEVGVGPRLGMCLVGRPVARAFPQDGTVGEVTRMVLVDGLPRGTASAVLCFAADVARTRRMTALIAYHDRSRHTGCIYKKAGFKKDGATEPRSSGWGNRGGREASKDVGATSKRRWRLVL